MKMQMPIVEVLGDDNTRIMARCGQLVGFSRTRAVWRFGFLSDSDAAKAFGVSVPDDRGFLWVITSSTGGIYDQYVGLALELPRRYRDIIDAEL